MQTIKNQLPTIITLIVLTGIIAAAIILHNSGALSMNPQ